MQPTSLGPVPQSVRWSSRQCSGWLGLMLISFNLCNCKLYSQSPAEDDATVRWYTLKFLGAEKREDLSTLMCFWTVLTECFSAVKVTRCCSDCSLFLGQFIFSFSFCSLKIFDATLFLMYFYFQIVALFE